MPALLVDQIFLGFDRSFHFCFWNQYIQTISKHNFNLPCLRFPLCGITDLRQTFLLYARQWLWRHKRTTTQWYTKRTQRPKKIMRDEIQIMTKFLAWMWKRFKRLKNPPCTLAEWVFFCFGFCLFFCCFDFCQISSLKFA